MKNIQRISIAILLILFGFVGTAFAHATPVSYEPELSSIVQRVPDHVRIHFSERIEPTASDITVLGPDGAQVSMGNAAPENDAHMFGVAVRDAGQGTYTVSWEVVSADDGHFTKGAFVFSVGKGSAVSLQSIGQIQVQHIASIPQALVMWIELVGQAMLLGAFVIMAIGYALAKRSKEKSQDISRSLMRRMRVFVVWGIMCILAGVISLLILKTLDLEQLRSTAFVPTFRIFVQTLDGMHALLRGALALLFGALFFFWRQKDKKQSLSTKEIILMLVIAGMALSRVRVSHSAATAFFPRISIIITAVQLLAKELWVGGLVALISVIAVVRKKGDALLEFFSVTLFSQIAIIAFGITGVTGAYIVWLDLKKPEYLFSSEWGGRFIILLIFGGLLLSLRFIYQMWIEKNMIKRDASQRMGLFKISRYLLCTEAAVGLALLLVTSFLIITTPPYPPTQFGFERHGVSQGANISFGIDAYEPDKFLVTIEDAEHSVPSELILSLTNGEKGVGPIVVDIQERFPGGYVFSRSAFSLTGNWHVNLIARRTAAFDATASFDLTYPRDIEASRIDPEHRSFGLFELSLLIIALFNASTAYVLYRSSKRLYEQCENMGDSNWEKIKDTKGVWFIAVCALIIASGIILLAYNTFIKTDFQKSCERDGNFWLQAVPMHDGVALSPDTVTGCTLNIGLYHFADMREYRFFTRPRQSMAEVTMSPASPIAGKPTDIRVQLSMVEQGKKAGHIQDIGIYHDRILHMIIIGEDLKTFAHIHAEDLGLITPEMRKTGIFPLSHIFPKAGRYAIVINYVQGGKELSQESFVNVEGTPVMEKNIDALHDVQNDVLSAKDFDGYHVTLDVPQNITAGEMTKLAYTVEKGGRRVIDLEPYLGAAMHLAILPADLSGRIIHTHGQPYVPGSAFFQQLFQNYVNYHSHFVPDHFGPKIQARIAFPDAGLYEVFGEFKHGSKVITTVFTINVK